ncbi:MAG: hypothetical protein DRJ09_07150 [Bacteroidetes bacterium]|nr:MAG: hypothetical protein DRJ09_07150 [Bacteroidota bacterium]
MKAKLQITLFMVLTTFLVKAQLTINPGGFITINPSGSMYVGTNLHINSDASGSGYWVDRTTSNDVSITGSVDIERYITQSGWHNTASPVNNAVSSVFTGIDLIFYYDETIIQNDWNFGWVWYSGILEEMKGYDVYISSPLLVEYSAASGTHLNSGIYSIPVTKTNVSNGESENHKGWNLIGNPYPSPVDWLEETGWDKTDINDAKYIWSPENNNYTIFLGGSNPTGVNGGTQFIPSNQGFWVQALQTGTVEINNACRTGTLPSTPDFYKQLGNANSELRIQASGNGYSDETLIRLLPEATIGFDVNKDAGKLFSPFDSIPQICTFSDHTQLAINSLPEQLNELAIPMEFYCNTMGNYRISIDKSAEILTHNKIYLKDVREQKTIDLGLVEEYLFYHDPTYNPKRFIIYFNPSKEFIGDINPAYWFSVTSSGNKLTIQRNTRVFHKAALSVYNMLGQIIFTRPINNALKSSYTLAAPVGYYMVTIQTESYLSGTKIYLSD